MAQPKIIAITAPSGAGKTTIVRCMLAMMSQLHFSVSATTRRPRPTEKHGVDYFFYNKPQFKRLIREDKLVEYEEVYPDTFYGTLRSELEKAGPGEAVLLDIDVKGALKLRELYRENSLFIFVRPPSMKELQERLELRSTESDAALQERLKRAKEEMRYKNKFDASLINHSIQDSVKVTAMLIHTFLGTYG